MDLFPSIDLRDGRVVRLLRGDYDAEVAYAVDPVEVALSYAEAGVRWVHVVDLDAALGGEPVNGALVAAVCAALPAAVRVQCGGGVRSVDAASALFDVGVARVVVGTAAMGDPSLVGAIAGIGAGAVAVGLDARSGEVAVHGWTESSGVTIGEALRRFDGSGASAFVVTEISRDGTLAGPDVVGLAAVCAATTVPVVASGGVGTLFHLRALAALPLEGVIVGRALYEGAFTVPEAIIAIS